MYSEIVAAIQSTKTAIDLVKAANGLSNYSELLTAVTAVQIKLTDAIASELASQEKQAAFAERVRELEKQLAEIEDWKNQIQRYALFQFTTGVLAYALKPGHENGEPMHYLCTACMDRKKKTTLQPHGRYLHCPECKTDIAIEKAKPINYGGRGGSWMTS
jgi:DNA-directed RNA polymerase subunit RPC12/RpoP